MAMTPSDAEHGMRSVENERCFGVSKTCRNSCMLLHRSAFNNAIRLGGPYLKHQ
jgi:uncharacterized membrane protein